MILKTKTKNIRLPAFFPDATHAAVKSTGTDDLENAKVQGLVINTYHALTNGSLEAIEKIGGLHKFTGFKSPIITDSGGFQVMSLVRRNPANGKITDDGIIFNLTNSKSKFVLTPENCIETQIKLGSDIIMCLDDCTDPNEPLKEQTKSIDRTVRWAKICKVTFEKLTKKMKSKPLLFSIVQGGNEKELRKKCAEGLIDIGFDGFAFGGWPVDSKHVFLDEIVEYTASVMPYGKPKYAMGVGKPDDIYKSFKFGYNMFDCVLPTRDARHKRLYVYLGEPNKVDLEKKFYGYLYINSGKYKYENGPISKFCGCTTCKKYSLSYLHHLFKQNEALAYRLATIHNLYFYRQLMALLKQ